MDPDRPVPRTLLLFDVAVAVWVVLWIGFAFVVGRQIADLDQLSDGLVQGGRAIEDTAEVLEGFSGVPFVGDDAARAAGNVRTIGRQAVASGQEAAVTIDRLSTTFRWIVLLYPTVPVVAAYLAWRIHGIRRSRRATITPSPEAPPAG
jgi:hypothetical protein